MVWRKGNPPTLLEGMLTGAVPVENSMVIPQKLVTIWFSNPTPSHVSRQSYNSKRYMQDSKESVHTSCRCDRKPSCSHSESEVPQSCPTLWDPMDCSPPGSFVHGILHARILEWVAISFSRGSSRLGIKPGSPALQTDALTSEPPGKPNLTLTYEISNLPSHIVCYM